MDFRDLLTLVRFKNTSSSVFYSILFSYLLTRNFIIYDFFLTLLSNMFVIWAIYSFNDLEDAKLESIIKKRRKFIHGNLILNGKISKNVAEFLILILATLALVVAIKINILNFYLILLILFIGFAYSSRYLHLKSKPPLDILSHAMIGPLIPLSVFIRHDTNLLYYIALLSSFLSAIVPEIVNQRYDYLIDKRNELKTSVQILGKSIALKLTMGLVFLIIVLNGIIFFLYGGINLALVYLLLSPLLIMFLTKKIRRLLETNSTILVIPLFINLFIIFLGFLNIL